MKLPNGNYQLIFGESKTIDDLTDALRAAFTSIAEFKNQVNNDGKHKSGINYEKSLISDNLTKETFSAEDAEFIRRLIYPKKENDFFVDDAFGIFIGYNFGISPDDKKLPNDVFRDKIKKDICETIRSKVALINKYIDENGLTGHSFHCLLYTS